MPQLTARQQEILALIHSAIENTGAPPTRAEIAHELGFRSANAAEEHLQALARKGVIALVSGTARGIRLMPLAGEKSAPKTALHAHQQRLLPLPSLAQLCLPLVGRVAAGQPILAQEHIDQTYNLDHGLFAQTPDFLLQVKGMSMRDAGILDGDLLAVKQSQSAHNGQIVVARLGDEVTVKRYQRLRNRIQLLPENPEFDPIIVPSDALDFAIEGLAVGLIRNQPLR
jgi:repressor LexA